MAILNRWSLPWRVCVGRAVAGQVEDGEGGVVGAQAGESLAVDGGGGVGPQGGGGGQHGSHAAAQAVGFALSSLVLYR